MSNQKQSETNNSTFGNIEHKANAKLNSLEGKFVSLSSQRQLNLILGTLILISALTGSVGALIGLVIGTLMIFQAASGNMVLNNFFDSMDPKYKKRIIPGLFGILILMVLGFLVMGLMVNPQGTIR